MEQNREILFDVVPNLQTATLDSTQLVELCKKQQTITMTRIASWLRSNARIYSQGYEVSISKQVAGLADELDYLSQISIDSLYRTIPN